MEYGYTVDGEDYPECATMFESSWTTDNIDFVAADAGEDYYDKDPDPEEYPLEVEIFEDGESIGNFEICLDFSPTFSATKI